MFSGKRKVIFVNGCFWRGHLGCSKATLPQTRTAYWLPKIAKNRENDKRNQEVLEEIGWHVLTVWQCELRTTNRIAVQTRILPWRKGGSSATRFWLGDGLLTIATIDLLDMLMQTLRYNLTDLDRHGIANEPAQDVVAYFSSFFTNLYVRGKVCKRAASRSVIAGFCSGCPNRPFP